MCSYCHGRISLRVPVSEESNDLPQDSSGSNIRNVVCTEYRLENKREATYLLGNTEAHSRNHCCVEKQ
jgi:hypothetical protein